MMVFLVLCVTLSIQRGCHHRIVVRQAEWWKGLGRRVILMHICQYQIESSIFTSLYFHDLFEAKMPQKTTNVQTVEVPSYKDATVWILRLNQRQRLEQVLPNRSIISLGRVVYRSGYDTGESRREAIGDCLYLYSPSLI